MPARMCQYSQTIYIHAILYPTPQSTKSYGGVLLLIDRLHIAAQLLLETYQSIMYLASHGGSKAINPKDYSNVPITSPLKDLKKNLGLAYMRLEALVAIGVERRDQFLSELKASPELQVSLYCCCVYCFP